MSAASDWVSYDVRLNSGQRRPLKGMPRFFFDTENGELRRDADGVELPTERAAELEAVRLLGELLADHPDAFSAHRALTVRVTYLGGADVFSVGASIIRARREP